MRLPRTRRPALCRLLLPMLLLAMAMASPAGAQQRPHTPPRGSPERQALMDALRETVGRELGKPVIFHVHQLRVLGDWAFVDVSPLQPDGSPFDFRGTPMEKAWREGFVDDFTYAVLRRQGGRWRVVRHAIGPTDVAWMAWEEELRLPRALFPYPN
ncbi:MAG TPA: hypothetical protein VK358_19380 [Longimicrobium sp.]|nr:hypothetical protein [Longimicrobium sp.]